MLNIGCHLSSAKGYLHMGKEALALGANTFQFFTRNPRGGRAKAIDTEDIRALLALMRENSLRRSWHMRLIHSMPVRQILK